MNGAIHPSVAKAPALDLAAVAPAQLRVALELERACESGPLSPALLELVKLRVSQMNGCRYCIWLHETKARKAGVGEEMVQHVRQWRDHAAYGVAERRALHWAELMTVCAHDADDDRVRAREELGDSGFAQLSFVVALINFWNRVALASNIQPGQAGGGP